MQLEAQPVSAARSREFVRGQLAAHGLSHLSDDVEMVVSELATNALAHARTPFTVTLYVYDEMLLLEVQDGSQARPVALAADPLDTAGRGVVIVEQLSRDWGTHALPGGGKSVWAAFALQ